ncbi:hypothetical protein CN135_25160 [Sinorhizobium meliloti]|uniref:hypothetical protein n=1 Tax=Sinorhizobium/Ensifer group TaxID=227292 RepID=UPI000FDCA464|nr:hypothetical protein [Sinorhizobium meliloti]RVL75350.1 hypothetical protein CN135_25160 [Sinorhizobium meliloti]
MRDTSDSRILNDDEGFWYFKDLVALGYVKDRADLTRKQQSHGFPRPEKPPTAAKQAAAPFLRGKVREWVKQRHIQAA